MPPVNMADYMKARRLTRRSELIRLAGGCCITCGGCDDLQFDHRDPATKKFVLSGCYLDRAWAAILEEFEKCDLLCRPCHLAKTLLNKELKGGRNRATEHGTEAMHRQHGCNCDPCRQASYDARVRRGEMSGARGRYKYSPVI